MTRRGRRSIETTQPQPASPHSGVDDVGNADTLDKTAYAALTQPGMEAVPITQVVFIEGSVADAKQLARGVAPGVIAVILSPEQDGMQQIAAWLASHDAGSLAAIDIVADGQDGAISLGTATLNTATIAQYQAELAAIGAALRPGGAIQIYGCDVAQDAAGDAFLQQISAAAGGASVAAASHLVGAAPDGGSWNLDFNTGTIDASAPFTQAAMSAYPGELGVADNGLFVFTQGNTANATTAVLQLNVSATGSVASTSTVIADTSSHEYLMAPFSVAIDASLNKYFVTDTNPDTGVTEILMGTIGSTSLGTILVDTDFDNSAIDDLALDQPTGNLYYTMVSTGTGGGALEAPGIYKINISNTGTVAFPGTAVARFTDGGFQNPNPLALDLTQNSIFFGNWLEDADGNNYANLLEVANPTSGAITNLTGEMSSTLQAQLSTTADANDTDTMTGIAVVPNGTSGGTLYYVLNVQVNGTDAGYIDKVSYTYNGSTIALTTNTSTTLYHSTTDVYNGIVVDPTNGLLYVGGASTSASGIFVESVNGGTPTQIYTDAIINGNLPTPFSSVFLSQPTLVASGTLNYNAGGSAIPLDSIAAVSNPDGTNLDGVTISIAGGFVTGDTLAATNITGISQTYASGTLTLTGNASAAQYQTEVDSVTFNSTSTTGGTRTIDWTATNGLETSATAVSSVAVHTAPTITAGATVTFTGGGSPVVLDSGLAITDSSGTIQTSATVTIGNFLSTDSLTVGTPGGLSSSFSNGVLTLTGTATTATYKAALDSVAFSENPSNGDPTADGSKSSHSITFSVNNGFVQSAGATSTVNLVHTAPTVTAGGTVTFSGGGLPVTLDSGLTVTDPDSDGVLSSATVTIGSAITGDTLNFTNTNSTTEGNVAVASDSGGVLVLTSSGNTATLAQWQTALEAVTYSVSPGNTDPTGGGTHTSRTITYSVYDGAASSAAATSTLHTVHSAPTITAGATVTFTGGSTSPITLESGLVLTDADSGGNISSATITLGGSIAGDTLNFANTSKIAGSYVNGVLTLTGVDTVADYQAALEAVTYSFSPSSGDPTGGGSHTSRTIIYSANDGSASSSNATSTLDTVHAAPTVTAGGAITYVIGNAPGTIDPTLALSDPDSGGLMQSATVSVAGGAGLGDILATNTLGLPSITATYNASNETLTLTGSDTLADYQAALGLVTITGTTAGTRTIDYTVNDGAASSAVATSSATIEAVPTIIASGTVAYHQGGTTPVVLDSGLTVTDPSASALNSATVTIGGFLSGDTLTVGTPGGLSTAFNSGVLTVSGAASLATYQAALDSVAYLFTPASGDPTDGFTDDTRAISWQATDANNNTSTIASSSLNVACFRSGTRIATPTGQVTVQHLAAGDLVMTADGAERSVIWTGRRTIDCTRHPRPANVWPVRIPAGAFGPACPSRDLFLSPDHAVLVDDVLVPVCHLIGAAGIQQVEVDRVSYFHIELRAHDIILAEDLPAESYLDTGDRAIFGLGGGAITLHPDFVARNWELFGCAPLVVCGPRLQAARRRMDAAKDASRSPRHGSDERSIALAG